MAEAVMLRQLMKLSQAVYESAQQSKQAQLAQRMEADVRDRLTAVKDRLPTPQRKQPGTVNPEQDQSTQTQTATLPTKAAETDLSEDQRAMLERMRATQGTEAEEAVKSPVPPKLEQQKQAPQPDRVGGRER